MIINSANKFVENISWWISFFTIIFWILALLPVGGMILMLLVAGPPRFFAEFLVVLFSTAVYVGIMFLLHRLSMIGFEFMKAIVVTAVECQNELKTIKEGLKKPPEQSQVPDYTPTPNPSPYNF